MHRGSHFHQLHPKAVWESKSPAHLFIEATWHHVSAKIKHLTQMFLWFLWGLFFFILQKQFCKAKKPQYVLCYLLSSYPLQWNKAFSLLSWTNFQLSISFLVAISSAALHLLHLVKITICILCVSQAMC